MPHYTCDFLRAHKGWHWKLLEEPNRPENRRHKKISLSDIKKSLDTLHFRYKESLTRYQGLQLFRRAQRGLLSYETLPISELKTFIAQRGPEPVQAGASRSVLQNHLEQADDNFVFSHFGDLSTELQVTILEFYFASFPDFKYPSDARPPPIAYASSLTRQLSLPIFYNTCRFALCFVSSVPRGSDDVVTKFYKPIWLEATDERVACISKLRVSIFCKLDSYHHIDVNLRDATVEAFQTRNRSSTDKSRLTGIAKNLQIVVDGIAAREGSKKPQKGDLQVLCHAVHRSITWGWQLRGH